MTIKQYSTIQRLIGNLEAIGAVLPDNVQSGYFDTIETLDSVIGEVWEVDNGGKEDVR